MRSLSIGLALTFTVAFTHSVAAQQADTTPPSRPTGVMERPDIEELERLNEIITVKSNAGDYRSALQAALASVQLVGRTLGQRSQIFAVTLGRLGVTLSRLGLYDLSETVDRDALTLFTAIQGDRHPISVEMLHNLASTLTVLGRADEAEVLHRKALAISTEVLGEKDPGTLATLADLASDLSSLGHFEESAKLQRKAFELRKEVLGDRHPDTLLSAMNLGIALLSVGQVAEAEELQRSTLTAYIAVLGEKHPSTVRSMTNLAAILKARGGLAETEALLQRALVLSERQLSSSLVENLSTVQLAQPNRAHLASSTIRPLVSSLKGTRNYGEDDARAEARRSRRAGRRTFVVLADANWAAGPGLTPAGIAAGAQTLDAAGLAALRSETFEALQDAMVGRTAEATALQAARRLAENAGLGEIARERQALSAEWQANDRAQSEALGASGEAAEKRYDNLLKRAKIIESRIAAIDLELKAKAPGYHSLTRQEALPLQVAQSLLKPDEATLLVVPSALGTHVMVLTKNELVWTRAGLRADEIARMVAKLRSDLDPTAGRGDNYDRQTAFKLYQELVAPMREVLADKRELFVAAAGTLASLPFGVLVAQPPKGKDGDAKALRETHWLADDFAITQIPTLQSLAFLRSSRPAESSRSGLTLAGFGDPVLSDAALVRGSAGGVGVPTELKKFGRRRDGGNIADVSEIRALPSLPGTAIELANLAKALKAPSSALHLRMADTETAARTADLSQVRVLSFATHGLIAGQASAAEPSLVFTPPEVANEQDDGLLTASEVTSLKLNAEWVILSACNTAAPEGRGDPGLSGLARAFFYAGGRSLLVSHWPVYDDIAPQLTVDTIRMWAENPELSKARALTMAMYGIRHDKSDPSRAHPSVWAPFSLVGDNR